MPCYFPLRGFRSRGGPDKITGSWPIVWTRRDGHTELPVEVPCGRCIGCRLDQARSWATRILHESRLYEENCFITLTYSDAHIPPDGGLDKRDCQTFFKRLRKSEGKMRYYLCGEYGDMTRRPHYHAIIFGWRPWDLEVVSSRKEYKVYQSDILTRIWGKGHTLVLDVTWDSAAYVARYCQGKITGALSDDIYKGRQKEFSLMSRKPGIGKDYVLTWKQDFKKIDGVSVFEKRLILPLPRYYNMIYETEEEKRRVRIERRKRIKKWDYVDRERVACVKEIEKQKHYREPEVKHA